MLFSFFILFNNYHIGNTAAQQKAGIDPTVHTNEGDFSRVCDWNLLNTFKESFILGIQRSKKMKEYELITFWHLCT